MSALVNVDRVDFLRRTLVDAVAVCTALGLAEGAKPQRLGLILRCPWHSERTPSCSVRPGANGTLSVHCFGCGAGGDVFDLVAVAHGLESRRDFPQVLRRATELAGLSSMQEARKPAGRSRVPLWSTGRSYPPVGEVSALWEACRLVGDVPEAAGWLASRGLDPGAVEDFGLGRALPAGAVLPRWARCDGKAWAEGGYRLILPMFDHEGQMRSLRARKVVAGDGPKNVAPAGFSTAGLIMADALGRSLLAKGRPPENWPQSAPLRVVVTEGEPDFLTWATRFSDADETAPAVLGLASGSWTAEIAGRIPSGAVVIIRTDADEAGERYALTVWATLHSRCKVMRGGMRGAA